MHISETPKPVALFAALLLVACGGDDTSTPMPEPDLGMPDMTEDMGPEPGEDMAADEMGTDMPEVEAPMADAGTDQTGEVNQAVTLDGTASTGADLSFSWSFVTRPDTSSASIDDANAEMATFTPDQAGSYIVELEVMNAAGSATDRVTIEVTPEGGLTSTVYVAPDGDDQNRGTEDEPLATFDAAIEVVRTRDMVERIELEAGPYDVDQTYTISEDLDISGPSDSEAIINGTSDLFELDQEAFLTLVDVTIRSPGEAIDVIEGTSVSLIGVTCEADVCVRAGTLFDNDGGRVEVRRSLFAGLSSGSSQGIVASLPEDVSVVDSTIRDFGQYGIQVLDGPLTLRDSNVDGNPTALSLVVNQSQNATTITNTTFDGNDTVLDNTGARNVTFSNTTLSNSTDTAIVSEGGAIVIDHSTIDGSGGHGIDVRRDAIVTVRDSTISNSQDEGIIVVGVDARLDLGDDIDDGNNVLSSNDGGEIFDNRPSGATGFIKLSATELSGIFPPPGTYSGPFFSNYNIKIANDTTVEAF